MSGWDWRDDPASKSQRRPTFRMIRNRLSGRLTSRNKFTTKRVPKPYSGRARRPTGWIQRRRRGRIWLRELGGRIFLGEVQKRFLVC